MAVRMSDVAQRAGVSAKTVSNVLNGYPHIRAETRVRVLEAIETLGYQVNVAARNLRAGRTGMLSLVIPEVTEPYFGELTELVMAAAETRGLTVLIELTRHVRERELAVVAGSNPQGVDGLIFAPTMCGEDELRGLTFPTPTVVLGERMFAGPVDNVVMPNRAGAADAVRHLVAHGCRRIAAVGVHSHRGAGAVTAGLRLQGFLDAHGELGVPVHDELMVTNHQWRRASGATAVRQLLDADADFDALFCFNDSLALGALHELLVAGVRVPEQVKVMGFDDTQDAAYSTPSLSSISPGSREIAEQAVALLHRRIHAEGDPPGIEVVVPHQLIGRRSTGAPEVVEQLRS